MEVEDQQQHLPVFTQPSEVNFVIGKPETHKNLLTIFNPYPFAIRFRVLCNAPSKYAMGLTKGVIRPGCYLDTSIRHKNPVVAESDCLRIEIYRLDDGMHPCGQKELPLCVLPNKSARLESQRLVEFSDDGSSSSSQQARSRAIPSLSGRHSQHQNAFPQAPPNSPNFYWLAVLSFLFCISVLLLPQYVELEAKQQQQQDHYPWIPHWLRPTSTSKCVSAYVLGILTVYFFLQPTA